MDEITDKIINGKHIFIKKDDLNFCLDKLKSKLYENNCILEISNKDNYLIFSSRPLIHKYWFDSVEQKTYSSQEILKTLGKNNYKEKISYLINKGFLEKIISKPTKGRPKIFYKVNKQW